MTVDKITRLAEEMLEAFNSHDVDKFVEFYAENAVHYQPTQSEPIKGRPAIREDYMEATFNAFPDVKFEKVNIFHQGEWVCVEGIFKGTHKGPLGGVNEEMIPPTNKYVEVPIVFVARVKDNKLVKVREYNDQLGFLTQLGVI